MKRTLLSLAAAAAVCGPVAPALGTDGFDLWSQEAIVIRRPGSYTLRRHLTARGQRPLITIGADQVSLDLNGFSLTGPGGKSGEGIVIEGRQNVRVHNGFLSDFGTAVRVGDSTNVDVSDLQITGDDLPGLPPETGVLLVNSRGVHVVRNVISRTFLGIFVRGGGSGANTIKANTIAGGDNGQLGVCYNPAPGADPAVDGPSGDVVAENHISRFQVSIQLSPATRANVFVRNYLNFFDAAIEEGTPGANTLANNLETDLGS